MSCGRMRHWVDRRARRILGNFLTFSLHYSIIVKLWRVTSLKQDLGLSREGVVRLDPNAD